MTLRKIIKLLKARMISSVDEMMDVEVKNIIGSDLMSDVLSYAKSKSLLLTGLVSPQVVRTATMTDLVGIVILRNKNIPQDTISLARVLNVPL